jgi:cell division protein ZapA
MSNEANFLDISLQGKEYRVACPPEERAALLRVVDYVDAKMRDIADKTKSKMTERIAVMVALNIAHEHLLQQSAVPSDENKAGSVTELDFVAVKRRILIMEAQLDAVLQPQEALP